MKEPTSSKQTPPPTQAGQDFREAIAKLESQIDELRSAFKRNGASRFNADDQIFLVWVLGFSAGAHLDRNGDQGERIFARCRDMFVKLSEPPGANPS